MRRILFSLCLGAFAHAGHAAPLQVVTDIAPVQSLVAMVMGDLGTPLVLLPGAGDPHDFQLRPSQARALAGADLVIWIGPELTPSLAHSMAALAAKAHSIALLDQPETQTLDFAPGEAEGDEGEGHGHKGLNPHAWLAPENGRVWLGLIARELSSLDPENAERYAANAARAQAEITVAEAAIAAMLTPVQARGFAVYHDAYGYFANTFGLHVVGSLRQGDAATPGAAHLKALQAELRQTQAVCLFPEVNHDDAAMYRLAETTGLRLGTALDPVGTATTAGVGLYIAVLEGLAVSIADCLAQD
ncbi:zinc ABC transporter substrate-binding protein [Pseudorhodobacter sp.]|uniref:zinc ABC transporter substrate-binding protein n=1 Tax=Pseudorhodobacter sp. TaxID=1934400 RepID=UPI002648F2AC|nr:zinc ABC transporter substrate-binding protein [Pseudorhodobacter sp.]MDN5787073.1 zinc ABC transporter substrate-binding protein [Pseudorhodobacter sp.]